MLKPQNHLIKKSEHKEMKISQYILLIYVLISFKWEVNCSLAIIQTESTVEK